MTIPGCQLYLLTPPIIPDPDLFANNLQDAMQGGNIALLQIRLKNTTQYHICSLVERLLPLCAEAKTTLILNDQPALAAKLGLNGVHLGADDVDLPSARKILGKHSLIGMTCRNSIRAASRAEQQSADYVAFGAFFPSYTKIVHTRAKTELIRQWKKISRLPCVAIGGITPQNSAPLIKAGADFLAVSASVWEHDRGAEKAVRQFHKVFNAPGMKTGNVRPRNSTPPIIRPQ